MSGYGPRRTDTLERPRRRDEHDTRGADLGLIVVGSANDKGVDEGLLVDASNPLHIADLRMCHGRRDSPSIRSGCETVSNLGVLTCPAFWVARRLAESDVVTFECSVHDGSPNLEHEVSSSRRPTHLLFGCHPLM